jgi:short-subunit dehydrogenase
VSPVAVVTGASSGIGEALALAFAEKGMDLALVARDRERLEEVAKQCRERFRVAVSVLPCDLSDPEATLQLARSLADLPVAVLANNAGFGIHGEFLETDLDDERKLLRLQLDATLALTKAIVPGMVARRRGRVLNVGSVYAFAPVPGQAVYAASKAFLRSFTETLAAELRGTGVTVTGVYPGVTRTEFRQRAGIVSKRPDAGATAASVAQGAVRACLRGQLEYVPGSFANRLFVTVMRHLAGRSAAWLMARINRARGLRTRSSDELPA